jgi:hypothetical protein
VTFSIKKEANSSTQWAIFDFDDAKTVSKYQSSASVSVQRKVDK